MQIIATVLWNHVYGKSGLFSRRQFITFIILHIMAKGSLCLPHLLSRHILKEFDIVLTLFCKCGVGFYFCK